MLVSNRISLKPIKKFDVTTEYLDTLNDKNYMKFSQNSLLTHDMNSQIEYLSRFNTTTKSLLGVRHVKSEKLVGTINYVVDFTTLTINLGFLIFREHQGKGYASEALGVLINFMQLEFPGMTLIIGSHRDNIAMHEVARKSGFQARDIGFPKDPEVVHFELKLMNQAIREMPTIPSFILNAKRIGVASFDAGGAEQLVWLLKNLPQKALAYLDGPAKSIFHNSGISVDIVDQLKDIMVCDLILTGSGWMSSLEVSAIEEAKLKGIPCVTILDHWVNYRERFSAFDFHEPDILATTNTVAFDLASRTFPNKLILQFPDFQTKSYCDFIGANRTEKSCVLVILEPLSSFESKFPVDASETMDLIKSAIALKRSMGLGVVLVRPHPAQDRELLHNKIFIGLQGEVEVSRSKTLLEDLKCSKFVLGFSSYALYLSAMSGIETYSYFAGMEGHWTMEFPTISTVPALE